MFSRFAAAARELSPELWKVTGGALAQFMASMVATFIALYLADHLHADAETIGYVLAVQGVAGLAGLMFAGRIVESLGPRRVLLSSMAIAGLISFTCIAADSAIVLAVLLSALFFARSIFRPAYNTHVIAICAPDDRGRAYALFVMAANLGVAAAAAAGGLVMNISPRAIFVLDAVFLLLALIVFVFTVRERRGNADTSEQPAETGAAKLRRHPLRDRGFWAVGALYFAIELVELQVPFTLPLYLRDRFDFGPEIWGFMMTGLGIGIILFSLPITTVCKKTDQRLVVAAATLAMCGSLTALLWVDTAFVVFFVWTAYVAGQIAVYPALMSTLMNRAELFINQAQFISFYYAISSVARLISPATAGWLYDNIGPWAVWTSCGCLGALMIAGVAVWLARGQPAGLKIGSQAS
ncbi:MAG: MFS transporter [Gammaproteobacteria bacterium]|nr:MFS transporter [Gammaproteobacteria bacterium]